MSGGEVFYLVLGATLVAALAAVVAHYYSRKRRARVEQAKYKMLDDDE